MCVAAAVVVAMVEEAHATPRKRPTKSGKSESVSFCQ